MINHIDSTTIASLRGNTLFKLAQILLNSILNELSLKHIEADEVHIKPVLLKSKKLKF